MTRTFGKRRLPDPLEAAAPARKRSVAAPFAAAAVVAAGAAYALSGRLSRPFPQRAAPAAPVAACDPARTPGCAQTQQSSRMGFVYVGSGGGAKTTPAPAATSVAPAAAPNASGVTARGGFGATGGAVASSGG